MPLKKLTPEQTASIRHQANNGVSVLALAAKYNISTQHIYRIKSNERRDRKKKQMSTYNGWTNYATWLFYLHHQENVEHWYYDEPASTRKDLDETHLQNYFEEMYSELMHDVANTYITDVFNNELRDVNWREVMNTLPKDNESSDDGYDANWTEEGAITNYLDHVAENKERERN
jgi:hypothetical protein